MTKQVLKYQSAQDIIKSVSPAEIYEKFIIMHPYEIDNISKRVDINNEEKKEKIAKYRETVIDAIIRCQTLNCQKSTDNLVIFVVPAYTHPTKAYTHPTKNEIYNVFAMEDYDKLTKTNIPSLFDIGFCSWQDNLSSTVSLSSQFLLNKVALAAELFYTVTFLGFTEDSFRVVSIAEQNFLNSTATLKGDILDFECDTDYECIKSKNQYNKNTINDIFSLEIDLRQNIKNNKKGTYHEFCTKQKK